MPGPSPHAWGELTASSLVPAWNRTIPTRVGRTHPWRCSKCGPSDHPHTRGENERYRARARAHGGPSPHAWGERCAAGLAVGWARTIPTRVGRTISPSSNASTNADHPHTRGENVTSGSEVITQFGPSPHAWGERAGQHRNPPRGRTIPTRVGRTQPAQTYSRGRADHPHTRGENRRRLRI